MSVMEKAKKSIKNKKKWVPVSGETFYFIYPINSDYVKMTSEDLYINHPKYFLTIGEAECYDSDTDTESNCFRTKGQAKKALKKIKDALKFTGE